METGKTCDLLCFHHPAGLPAFTSNSTSSSSNRPDLTHSQSEERRSRGGEEEVRQRKRRRKEREDEEDEDEERRFVGRMEVFGGGPEDASLTLFNYDRKRRRRENAGDNQSENTVSVVIRKNGYRWVEGNIA